MTTISKESEIRLYVLARAKLAEHGIRPGNGRAVILQSVADLMGVKNTGVDMLLAFTRPNGAPATPQQVFKRKEYKLPLAMRIAAEKSKSQPTIIPALGKNIYKML